MIRKKKLTQANKFVVFYGKEPNFSFSGYDVLIIEPSAYDDQSLQILKNKDQLVIAYLSIVEIPPWSEILRYMEEEDFLKFNGEKIKNQEYNNECADLRSIRWQNILRHKVSELLERRGFDGLFLDTIGFLEDEQLPPAMRAQQIQASCHFLQSIRKIFPEHLFIQNCGLFEVFDATKYFIDGVCWENPPLEFEQEWVKIVLDKLSREKQACGLTIFLLLENTKEQSIRYLNLVDEAKKRNFLYYHAQTGYTSLPLAKP